MAEGRVRVNGETAMIGQRADSARDEITVDGVPIARVEQKRYLMLNKPRGYVTTLSDEKGRKNVSELVADCGGIRFYNSSIDSSPTRTCAALAAKGISIPNVLQDNDAYHALAKADGLIFTGPTGTNVNDLTVLLIRR